MSDKEIISVLMAQNERLLNVLEKFAEQNTNIVVNSYNGSSAQSKIEREYGMELYHNNNCNGNQATKDSHINEVK